MNSITTDELTKLERKLDVKLPEEYKKTLLNYPFEKDSFAYTCMLMADVNILIEWNSESESLVKNGFMIGGDGGEESYYIDLYDEHHPVFSFDMETDKTVLFAKNIADYLAKIIEIEKNIELDEELVKKRRENSKWWEFWKRI